MCVVTMQAQSPRTPLFEEFTGENCPPCAATNPGLDAMLRTVQGVNVIKWQVPIPSAPGATWSLYQTNKADIDWRSGAAPSGYGYSSQWTSSAGVSPGITAAPTGVLDGKHLWQYGAPSDHPGQIKPSHLAAAASYTSPYSITLARQTNASFSVINLTVNIQCTASYTPAGPLVFRLVMTERTIRFTTPPGSNGEKVFHDVARAAYPDLKNGTSVNVYAAGQSQTFTLACTIPSNVAVNYQELAFVGFIQDDGSRHVLQSALSDARGMNDDASAISASLPPLTCNAPVSPTVIIRNHGENLISDFVVDDQVGLVKRPAVFISTTLAPGSSTAVTLPSFTANTGNLSYSYSIAAVNGNADTYNGNNTHSRRIIMFPAASAYTAMQTFSAGLFPPPMWSVMNSDNGTHTWQRNASVSAYAMGAGAAKYDFFRNGAEGDADELYLPPLDLSSVTSQTLFYDVAYAGYPGYTDRLDVEISVNCGAGWTTLSSKSGTVLATATEQTGEFFPTATQWRTEVIDLSAYTAAEALIRFRAISGNGNSLWLDNVNVSNVSTVGVRKNAASNAGVFPVPADEKVNVGIAQTGIRIFDAGGRAVLSAVSDEQGVVDVRALAPGVYSGQYTEAGTTRQFRLIIVR